MADLLCLHFGRNLRLDEVCEIVRAIGLLLAAINCDADTRLNDLIAQNEQGVVLGGIFSVDAQASEPSLPAKVAYRPHARNFEHAKFRGIRENGSDVVGYNLPVVRLGEVPGQRGVRQVLDNAMTSSTAAQADAQCEDTKTHDSASLCGNRTMVNYTVRADALTTYACNSHKTMAAIAGKIMVASDARNQIWRTSPNPGMDRSGIAARQWVK